MLPSRAAAIPNGVEPGASLYSTILPNGSTRPIALPMFSVNHMSPRAPAAIPNGAEPLVGTSH